MGAGQSPAIPSNKKLFQHIKEYTYENLRQQDLDFFKGLKIYDTIEINGVMIEIAHAAMDNDRYYFDSTDGHAAEIFPKMKCDYMLTGHCHKQYILQRDDKTIINPGSVGMPHGESRNPKYALLDIIDGTVSCELREVPYDMAQAIHAQFANGLVEYANYWAIGVLYDILTGEEWVMTLLKSVLENGDVYDEADWHIEAEKMGMKFTEQELLEVYQKTLR